MEDLSVSRRAQSNTSENVWGGGVQLFASKHTQAHTHKTPHAFTEPEKKHFSLFYGGVLNEKVHRKDWRLDHLMLDAALLFGLSFKVSPNILMYSYFFSSTFGSHYYIFSYFLLALISTLIYNTLTGLTAQF